MSLPETSATNGRKLTIREAAEWVIAQHTRDYRRTCIDYWRDKYGDTYARSVEREVMALWDAKKTRRR